MIRPVAGGGGLACLNSTPGSEIPGPDRWRSRASRVEGVSAEPAAG